MISRKTKVIQIAKPLMTREVVKAVKEVLESGTLAQGPKVEEFEQKFASYTGSRYAIATNSGTAALHIALLASGIKAGDEVITTPFTFIATANSILFCGAKPVFVDIDEKTFNIDPNLILEKITPNTKAVIVVHLYGQPCDMDPITRICQEHSLILIEDACQAHGAEYKGKKVGSFGIGCFSLYATKNMTTGEGGMITTNEQQIAQKAMMIRNHGRRADYLHEILGYNYRMTEIAAAIGICQLKELDRFNDKRMENAKFLTQRLQKIRGLVPPYVRPGVKHVFHQYTMRVTSNFGLSRDELRQKLAQEGIETAIYYPLPIHKQPFYRNLLGYHDHLPVSEKVASEVLSLPIHPSLSKKELRETAAVINDV